MLFWLKVSGASVLSVRTKTEDRKKPVIAVFSLQQIMTNHNNYTILYNLMILMFIIQYIICCMNSISSNQQLQYYLANLYEFARYHLISLIVIFIISSIIFVRYYGTNKNKAIALKYHALLMPLLSKWFRKNDGQLIYESPNIIKMYPSDRQSCLFAIISFALIPRQQILSFIFNPIFFRIKDELVVQIPVNNQNPLFLTAAIVRRKQIKTITKKSFPDIKQLCKQYKPQIKQQQVQNNAPVKLNVPNTHCMLVQKSQHVRYFLYSQKQANAWKTHGKSVKLVYISDVNKFSRYPMAVRMVINLHSQDLPPMLDWLICFVDRMSKAKMTIGQRKQAEKKRENFNISYQ